jgi:hypothetical protein
MLFVREYYLLEINVNMFPFPRAQFNHSVIIGPPCNLNPSHPKPCRYENRTTKNQPQAFFHSLSLHQKITIFTGSANNRIIKFKLTQY